MPAAGQVLESHKNVENCPVDMRGLKSWSSDTQLSKATLNVVQGWGGQWRIFVIQILSARPIVLYVSVSN